VLGFYHKAVDIEAVDRQLGTSYAKYDPLNAIYNATPTLPPTRLKAACKYIKLSDYDYYVGENYI